MNGEESRVKLEGLPPCVGRQGQWACQGLSLLPRKRHPLLTAFHHQKPKKGMVSL